jgi:signal transduction histidine kinase
VQSGLDLDRAAEQRSATVAPHAINEALVQTKGLLETFQALLRIGTVEGGVGRQRFVRVDLSELRQRIHQAYYPVVKDAGQITIAGHAPGIAVLGDAELLAQLFTNLIKNAIAHTRRGKRITTRLLVVDGAPSRRSSI